MGVSEPRGGFPTTVARTRCRRRGSLGAETACAGVLARSPIGRLEGGSAMSPIETEAAEYILWLRVHNYAETTIACRDALPRILHSISAPERESTIRGAVTFELLAGLSATVCSSTESATGSRSRFATQAQRLVPVAHFFTWLRRTGTAHRQPRQRPADAQARPAASRGDPEHAPR